MGLRLVQDVRAKSIPVHSPALSLPAFNASLFSLSAVLPAHSRYLLGDTPSQLPRKGLQPSNVSFLVKMNASPDFCQVFRSNSRRQCGKVAGSSSSIGDFPFVCHTFCNAFSSIPLPLNPGNRWVTFGILRLSLAAPQHRDRFYVLCRTRPHFLMFSNVCVCTRARLLGSPPAVSAAASSRRQHSGVCTKGPQSVGAYIAHNDRSRNIPDPLH